MVKKFKRLFQTISRLLLITFIVFTWFAPASPAYANTVSCVEDGNVLNCSIDVTDSDGVNISFSLTEATTVSFTTFTSLTCDAHSNEASAADPYLYLLDASDNVIASDDDSASHNDGQNFCWDSSISVTDLAAGSYTLNLNVYENFFGVFSMDIAGLAEVTTPTTTTTTTTSTTTSTTTTTTTTTTSTTTTTTSTTTESPPETTTSTTTSTTTTSTTTTTTEPPPPETTTTTQPPATTSTTTTTTEPPLIIFDFEELPEEFDLNEWLREQATEVEPDSDEPEPEPVQVFEETEFETETEETDLADILNVEELEDLEVEEIELLEELLDDPDIDVELVQELEEVLDEEITVEEIEALTENEDFDELPTEARAEIVEAVNEAPEEVKEQFEENVDVFSDGYGDYVQTGSTIPVDDRKTIIVVTTTVTAIGATIRPSAATTSTTGPTSGPTRRRGRNG